MLLGKSTGSAHAKYHAIMYALQVIQVGFVEKLKGFFSKTTIHS